jgi:hypothetical protein
MCSLNPGATHILVLRSGLCRICIGLQRIALLSIWVASATCRVVKRLMANIWVCFAPFVLLEQRVVSSAVAHCSSFGPCHCSWTWDHISCWRASRVNNYIAASTTWHSFLAAYPCFGTLFALCPLSCHYGIAD